MQNKISPIKADLEQHAAGVTQFDLAAALKRDSRLEKMCLSAAGLRLDLSKQLVSNDVWDSLVALAQAHDLKARIDAMFSGEVVNHTEDRPALHTALRAGGDTSAPYQHEIGETLARMGRFCDDIIAGNKRGHADQLFTDVVNIGIGGSHLGPELICDALRTGTQAGLRSHFLANVDGGEFARISAQLNPQTTLFVVASKSFTTVETRLNARSAEAWLKQHLGEDSNPGKQFVAVTANVSRALEFGIDQDAIFPMWDWVGGRYSMWSAIGLPIALACGFKHFAQLLAGARAMDQHFRNSTLSENLPVMQALIGYWNHNYLGAESYAVVPYDDRLRYLPNYLQQLEMESNGKSIMQNNQAVTESTAPVTWGGLGTNAQHAFFQLLHQGTRLVPIDFIVALTHPESPPQHHDLLVANCFAQAEGLMSGRQLGGTEEGPQGVDLVQHKQTPGKRPSSTISVDALTPETLGALVALYEHKTFVQSVLWQINAFDQWGVELGKELATTIAAELGGGDPQQHDVSTTALIKRYLRLKTDD